MFKIPQPPSCNVCGASPGYNHLKDCNFLAMLRAISYPRVLDDNGVEWEHNFIKELQTENTELRAKLKPTDNTFNKTSSGELK